MAAAAEAAAGPEGPAGASSLGGMLARRRLARHYLALASSQLDTLLGECMLRRASLRACVCVRKHLHACACCALV